jgi:hypothetical protein
MLNKLESADDHLVTCRCPGPSATWTRCAPAWIVVEDAAMMAAVLEAIGAHVGRFLRSKNAFRKGAEVSHLPYKVMHSAAPRASELAREAARACGEIVERG